MKKFKPHEEELALGMEVFDAAGDQNCLMI
jgi:hypothetical protein